MESTAIVVQSCQLLQILCFLKIEIKGRILLPFLLLQHVGMKQNGVPCMTESRFPPGVPFDVRLHSNVSLEFAVRCVRDDDWEREILNHRPLDEEIVVDGERESGSVIFEYTDDFIAAFFAGLS